jgi:hypothetical protein
MGVVRAQHHQVAGGQVLLLAVDAVHGLAFLQPEQLGEVVAMQVVGVARGVAQADGQGPGLAGGEVGGHGDAAGAGQHVAPG